MYRIVATCLFLGVLVAAASGCRGNNANVQSEKAETALQKALDAWARGEPADKFADAKQPIQLTDPDWKAGHRLLSFLVVEATPTADNPKNVRCKVTLSKAEPGGEAVEKEVVYLVQMGSKIVIDRQP
jgi:hypothetical protein